MVPAARGVWRSWLALAAAAVLAACTSGGLSVDDPDRPADATASPAVCPTTESTVVAEPCWVGGAGPESARPWLVLFGDSHAAHWWSAAARVGEQLDYRVATLTKPSCPAPQLELTDPAYPECSQYRMASLAAVRTMKPHIVLVGSSHAYEGRLPGGSDRRTPAQRWGDALEPVLGVLSEAADHVFLIRDVPRFAEDVAECMDAAADPTTECGLPEDEAISPAARAVARAEAEAAERFANVSRVTLNGLICRSGFCSPIDAGGRPRYKDSNHLVPGFAVSAAPALARAVRRVDRGEWTKRLQ